MNTMPSLSAAQFLCPKCSFHMMRVRVAGKEPGKFGEVLECRSSGCEIFTSRTQFKIPMIDLEVVEG